METFAKDDKERKKRAAKIEKKLQRKADAQDKRLIKKQKSISGSGGITKRLTISFKKKGDSSGSLENLDDVLEVREQCPQGMNCNSTDPEHFMKYQHTQQQQQQDGGGTDETTTSSSPSSSDGGKAAYPSNNLVATALVVTRPEGEEDNNNNLSQSARVEKGRSLVLPSTSTPPAGRRSGME